MTGDEQEHADLVKLGRLDWLADTMTTLRAREQADPGTVDDEAVMALHASLTSWANLLRLDVPA